MIFQLIDDHSRYAVASHVASGETSEGAVTVVSKAIAAHGVPQRLLSDNGAALNPTRRGMIGQLVTHVNGLGVQAITGKPGKPTTQGKNERFHQTLFRWLDKQPLAGTLEQLQDQVDRFDVIYNTERPHQALPGRVTPALAWHATPKADPPRPAATRPEPPAPRRSHLPPTQGHSVDGIRVARIKTNGTVKARSAWFQTDSRLAGTNTYIIYEHDTIMFFDEQGTLIIEHSWPAPGVKYVGNGKPQGPRRTL